MNKKNRMQLIEDVKSPINLQNPIDARQWALDANLKRQYRKTFFEFYATLLPKESKSSFKVLEIGSGPGHLAQVLLHHDPLLNYTAVDFSEAMHKLSQTSLAEISPQCVQFICADFKQPLWYSSLHAQKFDLIIIHQALHELRHKVHSLNFHQIISKNLLMPHGIYCICDHLAKPDGNMQNSDLYMNIQEHLNALEQANFNHIEMPLNIEGLCLFVCKLEP